MNIEEVIEIADKMMFADTGKPLDELHKAILKGIWSGQKYAKIAEDFDLTEGHIKDTASELLKLLSQSVGKKLNKFNFRHIFESLKYSFWYKSNKDIVHIGNINFCGEYQQLQKSPHSSPSQKQSQELSNTQSKFCQDLREMPKLGNFYNRTSELDTIQQWILHDHCRLVTILGIVGIGKTALTVELVERIKHQFDYVYWRSFNYVIPWSNFHKGLWQLLSAEQPLLNSVDNDMTELIDYLNKYRCLIILDDVQMLYSNGELAGHYKPEYEDYRLFFQQIANLKHNSCLVLVSQEKPREISTLEETKTVRSMSIKGLGDEASKIFQEKGLLGKEKWLEVIFLYQGNPLWLKIVATMINDLFVDGNVSEFIADESLFLGDLEVILENYLQRLSDSEKKVVFYLSNVIVPVQLSEIQQKLQLKRSEILKIMQSLERRFLIEKIQQNNQICFTIQTVFGEYIKSINSSF